MTAVFILRHDAAAAAAMQARLEATPRIRVAGAARQCFVAHELLPDSGADLLLADLQLPDGSALTLLHELPLPRPKLLLLTRSVDDALLLESLRAGADGYWLESDPGRELDLAIAETMRDEAVMAPPIARQVTGYFSAGGARLQPLQLTDVDRELLLRLGRGQSPSEIARTQGPATASDVRRRIRQIYRKMQWDLRSWQRAAA